jgi:hypothetical protein
MMKATANNSSSSIGHMIAPITGNIGFWAALCATCVGYLYLVGYIVLLANYELIPWTDVQHYAETLVTPYGTILTVLQVLAFLQALAIGTIVIILHESVDPSRKVLTTVALAASTIFVALSSVHYFVQWASVRQSILKGNLEGLGNFVQFNFDSPLSAINMLGWTLFYGIACIALAPVFGAPGKEQWIKWGFIASGINGIATAVGLALGVQLMYLTWTVGISITWYVYPMICLIYRRKRSVSAAI